MDLGANECVTFLKVTLPLIAPGDPGGGPARLRALGRRLRDHELQRRHDRHVPAVRLGRRPRRRAAAGQRDRHRDLRDRRRPYAHEHPDSEPSRQRRGMSHPRTEMSAAEQQQAARDHLWMHFTRMGGYGEGDVPIIVRGDGCYLEDVNGKRYLDGLAGLFSVNIGYGYGEEIGQAALEQMRELPFYTNWSYAHPRAIELAHEIAQLAPGDLNRVFFVSGGSEAVESAWKLARQYYVARGEKRLPRRGERAGGASTMRSSPPQARRRTAPRRSPATSPTTAPRWARSRSTGSRRSALRSSRSCRRCATSATRTATTARRRRPRRSSPPSCSTTSSRRSWRWAPRPCASCTWSRCRTPAARSRPRRATGAACARSATATTSCSPPTR